MTIRVALLATLAGLCLGATPFLRYAHLGHGLLPHADHAPRHGGTLVMLGDQHLELARTNGEVRVYVSDGVRRPLTPVRVVLEVDEREPVALEPRDYAWVGADVGGSAYTVHVWLERGPPLRWTFGPS